MFLQEVNVENQSIIYKITNFACVCYANDENETKYNFYSSTQEFSKYFHVLTIINE